MEETITAAAAAAAAEGEKEAEVAGRPLEHLKEKWRRQREAMEGGAAAGGGGGGGGVGESQAEAVEEALPQPAPDAEEAEDGMEQWTEAQVRCSPLASRPVGELGPRAQSACELGWSHRSSSTASNTDQRTRLPKPGFRLVHSRVWSKYTHARPLHARHGGCGTAAPCWSLPTLPTI
jgi:hypothetical protein